MQESVLKFGGGSCWGCGEKRITSVKNDKNLMKFRQLQLWPTRNQGSPSPMPPGPIVRSPKLREMSEKSGGKPEVRGSGVDEVEKLTF